MLTSYILTLSSTSLDGDQSSGEGEIFSGCGFRIAHELDLEG